MRRPHGHGRGCPQPTARHHASPRCGVRHPRTTALRPGLQLARLPGAVLVTHRAPRTGLLRRVLLSVLVTNLLLLFLALVVYLGRHAGT
ncbi:hypothetical protein HEK616_24520 [Streptomyces nigrescens]|uniref:Uncharacterized protein n=1 Tax=Streptomyces nigrescens TaxID=1920 RepID=A0ABM7ZRF0_STRNI|nr:hypothetical protein HEK616_24520 [Streptomyces nigrescens]